ncbi:MAG: hypothetical protein ACREAZ_02460 [Nitrososphaera sp.]
MVGSWFLAIVVASVVLTSSIAYALLFTVTLTDLVTITDKPSRSQSPRDNVPLADSPSSRETARDDIPLSDDAILHTPAKDTLQISESASAQSNTFYSVAASDTLLISEISSPGTPIADVLDASDKLSSSVGAQEMIALADAAARNFIVLLSDIIGLTDQAGGESSTPEVPETEEEEQQRRGRDGPDRVVFDESYFVTHPSSRVVVRSLYFVNSQDKAIVEVRVGQDVQIAATTRNYQSTDQPYVLLGQITDADNIAVKIVQVFGVLPSGGPGEIRASWAPEVAGIYTIKVMIWTDLDNPTALSEPVSKEIPVVT